MILFNNKWIKVILENRSKNGILENEKNALINQISVDIAIIDITNNLILNKL